jgi:HEAT repeat protein
MVGRPEFRRRNVPDIAAGWHVARPKPPTDAGRRALIMQRSAGNRAVCGLLAGPSRPGVQRQPAPGRIRPDVTPGQINDPVRIVGETLTQWQTDWIGKQPLGAQLPSAADTEIILMKRKLAAIAALGDLRDERVVPTLLGVLHDSIYGVQRLQAANKPVLRSAAAEALAKVGGATADSTLTGLLNHADPGERMMAAEALAEGAGSAPIAALLGRLAIEQDPRIKFKIVSALGKVGGNSGTAADRAAIAGRLIPLMQNSTGDLKFVSITGLGHLKLAVATAPLLQELRLWLSQADLSEVIVRALGEIADPSAVSDLTLMLTKHGSAAVRAAAAHALGTIGDGASLAALRKALATEKDAGVRAVIAKFVP